jgi:hypothetical protein
VSRRATSLMRGEERAGVLEGAPVLKQNEQRNHCYSFLSTSKNSLAVSKFLVFPRSFLSSSAVQVTTRLALSCEPVKGYCARLKFV